MPRQSIVGLLLALAAVLMWGAQLPVAKLALRAVDVLQLSLFRYGLPTLVLCALLWLKEGRRGFDYGDHARHAWGVGFIGMTCSPLLVFAGLSMSRPETIAIISATQPTMAVLAEWLMRGRRPPRFTLICVGVAFFGVVTVVTRWSLALAPSGTELFGDLLALAGAACWVVYTMTIERFSGWSSLRLTTLMMIPGAAGIAVLCLFGYRFGWIAPVNATLWLSVSWQVLYLALIGVLLAMICWNIGARRLGTLNVVLFLNLTPIVTFAIRYWQGQRFQTAELVGAAMVIGALVANNLYQRRLLFRAKRQAENAAFTSARSPAPATSD